ncbi:unnamed protein product [Closterium sp. NIES-65]|nr:unnamed protein product [Closterium sp. NIES-65]
MDRSSLLPQTAARPRTAFAYVPLALTLGLFTFLFFSRLAYESRDAGSSVDGRDEDGLSCGFLPKLFSLVSNESLALHLRELTAKPHIAGTPENFETARYVKEKFESYGLRAHYADYPVLLSYPLRQSLRLVRPVARNFSLREEPVHGDPFSASRAATDPFNAYSGSGRVGGKASGRVSGKGAGEEEAEGEGAGKAEGAAVVYANYGRMEDFEELVAAIGEEQVKGAVALIRYGKTFRGDKVRNAERFGVAAVLLYSDPADYAPEGTDAEHVYPQQQWLPATGAQRGTIYTGKGDPATPGWPSHPGGERLSHKETAKRLPRIPVLPVGYSVAGAVMAHMGGSSVPEEWQGGMTDVQYVFGPGPAAVDLEVQMNATVTTIRNVIGVLPGSHQPDRYIILGNHRDAWVFGAADPNSGTTCLLEVARAFGHMATHGWSPRRSLVFASWDAEEYGCVSVTIEGWGQPRSTEWAEDNAPVLASSAVAYIHQRGRSTEWAEDNAPLGSTEWAEDSAPLGSTEWVEDNAPVLATSAMAYINVDVAVGGGGFHASATPQLDDLIRDVSSQVGTLTSVAGCADGIEPCGGLSEYQPVANPDDPAGESILEGWAAEHSTSEPELGRLGGGGSDYAAFLQHLGIAAADTHFGGSYPMYHSVYDNYHWMATFADPLFKRHVAVTKMMAGVAARLAGDHRLPFNYSAYAAHLEHDVARLQADVAAQGAPSSLSVEPLFASVSRLLVAAQGIEAEIQVRIQAGIQGCTAVGCTAVGSTAVGCTAVGCTAVGCTAVGCTAVGCTAVGCTAVGCTAVGCTAQSLPSSISISRVPPPFLALPFLSLLFPAPFLLAPRLSPISHPPNPTHPSHHHSALQHPAAAHAGARGGGDAPWRAHLRKAQTEAIRPHPTPSHPATPPTTTAHRSGQQQRVQVHEGEGMPHGGGGDAPWRGRGCPMEGEGMPHGGGGDAPWRGRGCPMEGEGMPHGGGGDAPWRGRGCPMEGEGMPHGGGGDAPWRGRGCPMEGEGMPHGGGGDAPWRGRGCPRRGRGCPMEGEGMPHGGGGDAPWRGRGCPRRGRGCAMEGEGMPHGGGGDAPWRGRGCPMEGEGMPQEGEGMPHGGGGDAPGGGGDAPGGGGDAPGGGGDAPWRKAAPTARLPHPFHPLSPLFPSPLPPPQRIAASSSSACRCTRGRGCPMEEGSANCPSSKAFDAVNERLFLAERGFLDGHGIGPHYTWFKHLVYGPEKDNDYATSPFPGIRDAIADVISSSASKKENPEAGAGGAVRGSDNNEDGEEWKAVQHEIFRAARAIERAAKILEGQLL